MEITKMLLAKRLHQMHEDFKALYHDIKRFDLEETQELKIVTHVKMQELEMMLLDLEHLESVSGTSQQARVEESLRMMRHDFHAAMRKWLHLKSLHDKHDAVIAA